MNSHRGKQYGEAGKNLGNSASRFGRHNARSGATGEQYFARALKRNRDTSRYAVYQSLRMPTPRGQKRYSDVDIDFVIASGNKIILVDSKRWSAKHFYWSAFGRVMKDFTPGDLLSKNMLMARERMREMLPGHQIEAIVCFVPVGNGRMPKSVGLLIWPGRIRSYLANDGIRKVARFLGAPESPSARAQGTLGSLTR